MIAAGVVALAAALLFAVGSVAQQRAASQITTDEATGLRLMLTLIRRPLWWAGFGGDAGGYALQAIALGLGSLLLVQPLLVASLDLRVADRRAVERPPSRPCRPAVGRRTHRGAGAVHDRGRAHAGSRSCIGSQLARVGVALGALVGLSLIGAALTSGAMRASLLAIATGVCFGLAAALTKSVVDQLTVSLLEPFTSFELYALVAAGALGFFLQQEAFQAGSLEASLPAMTVLEPIVAAGVGIAILQEHLRSSGLEIALLAVTVVVMIAATVALSRSAARAGVT